MNVYVLWIQQCMKMDKHVMLVCSLNECESFRIFSCKAIVMALALPFECRCVHGRCVDHNDEKTGQQLRSCACLPCEYND